MKNVQSMQAAVQTSCLDGGNAGYLEALYEQFLADPRAVSEEWRHYFSQLPSVSSVPEVSHLAIQQTFATLTKQPTAFRGGAASVSADSKAMNIQQLIQSYRLQGHRRANIEPLGLTPLPAIPELTLKHHGLSEADYDRQVDGYGTLKALEAHLQRSYCGSVGTEFLHIVREEERQWIQTRVEARGVSAPYSLDLQKQLLGLLTDAEGLEKYIGAKFPGAKRFSLEGGDSFLVLLDTLIRRGARQGIQHAVIGMAHRGRLNVLVNTLGKKPSDLFDEFAGKHETDPHSSGDVKYHQGFSGNRLVDGVAPIHVTLAFNPSHLEIVSPVVEGAVRARQVRLKDHEKRLTLPISVHGDAAFAGQGVVMETFNMSQTRGYGVGGTVHIVINNQVGFTTSHREDARSTLYCSDVAKIVQAPIFHVNADDVEAVCWVAGLALDYKTTFKKDVVIDLVCYRRHGHNEADEPSATQPIMYQKIRQHPTVRQIYADQLVAKGLIVAEEAELMVQKNRQALDQGDCVAREVLPKDSGNGQNAWVAYRGQDWRLPAKTGIPLSSVQALASSFTRLPEGLALHPRVAKIVEDRKQMAQGTLPCDWGFGETLAYAALLEKGFDVRLSGQDCGRGTFFHRHAALHCQKTGQVVYPLGSVNKAANFTVIDSLLSEEAVMAFEYGYATSSPNTLVIWEAQFGDFANGAQVVIDQFISSGEQKWGRLCGLVLRLPHGYEGQGPEHSSARLERYLQLCAEQNMQVCVPSTPAQIYHLLCRQMQRQLRKPLIIMSPKSLLRHKEAVSLLSDFVDGQFLAVLPDPRPRDALLVKRVVLCSGKVFYDLDAARLAEQKEDVAIVRIEQLYPFPEKELQAQLAQYPEASLVVWCQEEPQNQGAWYSSQHHMRACLSAKQTLMYAGRLPSASPAAGSMALHQQQQEAFLHQALHEKGPTA